MFLGVGTQPSNPIPLPLQLLKYLPDTSSQDKWHCSPFGRKIDGPCQNEGENTVCYCVAQLNTNHLQTSGKMFEIVP